MRGNLLAKGAGLLLFLVVLVGSVGLWAQSTTAEILGTVTEQTGAVLAGATVKVTSLATGEVRTTTSDDHGNYVVNSLLPARYKIEITVRGFKTFSVPNLLAAAGDRARVDASLITGEVTETVEVEAATPLLQTDSATLATTVVEKSVQDLPLNGRNFVQLAQLTMGANEGTPTGMTSGNAPDDRRQSSSISVNGQSELLNNEMIDGADNNERIIGGIGIRPSIEAISEFRVQTSDYTAESGRTAGGVINIITKSGSNQFHGSAYEFFRNDLFDATTYLFAGNTPLPKSELRQNQFGGSLGGPILHNKTFFFGDYEGYRLVQGISPQAVTVPTSYEEDHPGDFTDLVPGLNVSSSVSPIALNWFKLFPKPSNPGATAGNYMSIQKKTQDSSLSDIRIDHSITPNDTLYGRYSYNSVTTFTPGLLPPVKVAGLTISPGGNVWSFAGSAKDTANNIQLNYTHLFSQTLVMNLVTSYLRIDNQSLPLNYGTNAATAFGYTGVNISQQTSALTPLNISGVWGAATGYATVGDGVFVPIKDLDNVLQFAGTATWTRGIHNIKFGASLIHRNTLNAQDNYGIGQLSEFNAATIQANLANFLEGNIDEVMRQNDLYPPHYLAYESGEFVQDDLHIIKPLTLNVGIRYDIITPFAEAGNHISNFNPVTAKMDVASSSDRTAGVATHYTNVAPRFGFEYDMGRGLVLRGGFGMSFYPGNYTSLASLKNQPFAFNFQNTAEMTLAQGMPVPTASSATDLSGSIPDNVEPDFHISYVEQYNLVAQKQLGRNVLTVSYVGSQGRHTPELLPDINVSLPSGTATSNPRLYAAVLPNVSSIGMVRTEGKSNYNALQTAFQRRYVNGLAVDFNYTYARGLDNSSGFNGSGDGYGASPSTRGKYEYGTSDLEMRHRLAGNVIYALPFGAALNGARALALKGWQVNALAVWETSLPFTVMSSSDVSGTESGDGQPDRPNMIGKARLSGKSQSKNEWFNVSAFQIQNAGTLGNEERNQLYGPHYTHLDLSLFKDFPVKGNWGKVQFRAECFNLTNTPEFGTPGNVMSGNPGDLGSSTGNADAGFGSIYSMTASYLPRVYQFAVKLQF
jgi:hypothetical protein